MQQQHRSTAPSPAAAKPGDQNLLDVTLESCVPMHATGDVGLLSDVRAPTPEEQEEAFGGVHPVAALGRLATPHFDVPDFRHVPGLGQRTVVVSVCELAARGLVVGFGPRTSSGKTAGAVVAITSGCRCQAEEEALHGASLLLCLVFGTPPVNSSLN
jgi:hypothetical protein